MMLLVKKERENFAARDKMIKKNIDFVAKNNPA